MKLNAIYFLICLAFITAQSYSLHSIIVDGEEDTDEILTDTEDEDVLESARETPAPNITCNGTFTGDHGTITTPGHPGPYPNKITCDWSITVADDMRVLLIVKDVHLRAFDRIYVYDGAGLNGRLLTWYRRYQGNKHIVSSTNRMFIRFLADTHYYTKMGTPFVLTYKAEKYGCDLALNDSQGVIHSPGYPTGYYENLVCEWNILVPLGRNIIIMFDDFETTDELDYLHIFGTNIRVSGATIPANFITHSNRLRLRFATHSHSGYSAGKRGFKISYKTKVWDTNTEFLLAAHNAIARVRSNRTKTIAFNGHRVSHLIDHDIGRQRVVWFDRQKHRFVYMTTTSGNSTTTAGQQQQQREVYAGAAGRPNSLAVDWIRDRLYWLDIMSKTIKLLDFADPKTQVYTVCDAGGDNPRDLVLNVAVRALVWSTIGTSPQLIQSQLDGSNQTALYDTGRQAYHLTVDYQRRRYFFVDIDDWFLYSIDFLGSDERMYIKSREFFDAVHTMFALNGDLYLANEHMVYKIPEIELRIESVQVLYKSHRFNVTTTGQTGWSPTVVVVADQSVDIDRQEINGFRIADPALQPMANDSASDGCLLATNCPNLCLPAAGLEYRCLTPDSELMMNSAYDYYYDRPVDKLSVVNSVFIALLIVVNVVLALFLWRIKVNARSAADTPVLMSGLVNNGGNHVGHHEVTSRSNENLLESLEIF